MLGICLATAYSITSDHWIRERHGTLSSSKVIDVISILINRKNTSTVPTWQSETSKAHRRGQMVMIEGSLIVFGVMVRYTLVHLASQSHRTDLSLDKLLD